MSNLKILLVEDDPDDVELLHAAFRDHGLLIHFSVIRQGDKVLQFLHQCRSLPDVLILDLNLPKIHGREVLSLIKSSSRFNGIPVVVLTTSSAKDDMDFCLATGADHFLVKPVTMAGYEEIISVVIDIAGVAKTK